MNIKGFTTRVVAVPPAESAALVARQQAKARLLAEQKAAREAAVRQAADEGWRRLCRSPERPDNVTNIEEARK